LARKDEIFGKMRKPDEEGGYAADMEICGGSGGNPVYTGV